MAIRLFQTQKDNRLFRIEGVYPEGSYLYIFDVDNPVCTHDYLQDDNPMCMRVAEDMFQVPLDSWQELPTATLSYTEIDRPASWNEIILR
jgi:hypothetical protein